MEADVEAAKRPGNMTWRHMRSRGANAGGNDQTIALMSSPSSLQYSGTSAA